jgi:5-methyltetrahydrofolate--homocysteine methyltransferase
MDELLQKIRTAIVEGRHKEIEALVRTATDRRLDAESIVNGGMIAAMDAVGERFGKAEIFVPEMLVSAHTMKKGLEILKPFLRDGNATSRGKVMMGTVRGDIHDIGKNLVVMMLEGSGFEVIDLGVNMDAARVVEEVAARRPQVLGLSALLTTTMPEMKNVIEALEARGLRKGIRVMVGGAPLDAAFAKEIGADGYGRDASEAVALARNFVS